MATAALVVLALGAAAGRWQVLPAARIGAGVPAERGDLVFVVPVSSLSLRDGDSIYVQYEGRAGAFRQVVGVVDSWEGEFELRADGDGDVAQLPPQVWRVSRTVPMLGVVFHLFVGPTQSIVLVIAGIALIALSELRRNRAQRARDESELVRAVTDDTPARIPVLHG